MTRFSKYQKGKEVRALNRKAQQVKGAESKAVKHALRSRPQRRKKQNGQKRLGQLLRPKVAKKLDKKVPTKDSSGQRGIAVRIKAEGTRQENPLWTVNPHDPADSRRPATIWRGRGERDPRHRAGDRLPVAG